MTKALEGVTVLDLGQIYNGPYCSLMLAFQGAEVIKVEPLNGENLRVRRQRDSHELLMLNSNKKSISIDLKSKQGKEIFKKLVKKSDILVENFSKGAMERLGLGYEVLREINPGLIYATGKGYGLDGPYSNFPAMDLTIQAMAGVMATTGFPENPPVKAGPAISDFLGAVHLFGGITTALYHREKTGKGQLVEVSMHDATYPTLASALGTYYNENGKNPERTGNNHTGMASCPYNVYPTKDGHLAILCATDKQWTTLVKLMKKDELLDDVRFQENVNRAKHTSVVDNIVSDWTSKQSKEEISRILSENHVPNAPVLSIPEVANDKHLKARNMIVEVDHPVEGRVSVPGSPIRLSDSPLENVFPAPLLGEHTEEILIDKLNMNRDDINSLIEKRILRKH